MINWDYCGKENSSSLSTGLQTYHATLAHLGDANAANNLGDGTHSKNANYSMHRHSLMFKLESEIHKVK
jgi:hypothetical protein